MRKMASVQKVREILPHNNADALEIAMINDWQVVVKKGEFEKDQLVVYFEVDSWIPNELAPFLSRGKEPREYEGVKGERLRTAKMRGEISQGLVLPIEVGIGGFLYVKGENGVEVIQEGDDVSEILNVKKWEPVIPACLRGRVKGNFPIDIPKTDQERIQNLSKHFDRIKKTSWEVTEKLHGGSCTFYLDSEDVFHVCSRNLDLEYEENNAYWKAAILYNVESMMKSNNMQGYAVQGELIGEGINGNQYGIKGIDFFVFDVFNANEKRYLNPYERYDIVHDLRLRHVPVINVNETITCDTIQELLLLVQGRKSYLNDSNMEGYVFKTKAKVSDNRDVSSFKVISNTWLLKNE